MPCGHGGGFQLGTSRVAARISRGYLHDFWGTYFYMFFSACLFPFVFKLYVKKGDRSVSKSMIKHPEASLNSICATLGFCWLLHEFQWIFVFWGVPRTPKTYKNGIKQIHSKNMCKQSKQNWKMSPKLGFLWTQGVVNEPRFSGLLLFRAALGVKMATGPPLKASETSQTQMFHDFGSPLDWYLRYFC